MSALMYHDIVDARAADSSGFAGRDAALYKVAPAVFEDHLDAILRLLARAAPPHGFEPTFDDGGRAALTAADSLEKRGLRGSFFITVNYIGTRGFVSKSQLIELRRRGHRIGSHSCSHPLRMGHCEWPRLIHEWAHSRAVLSDLLSEDVRTASIPGGDFSPDVARAAAEAGYIRLFTSEPSAVPRTVHGLTLVGRFAVRRWTSASTAAALASERILPCAQQAVLWKARKFAKRIGGREYLGLRRALLGLGGDEVVWGDERWPERRD
jgi:peptidoglycan/xylan/chitin deacetylase (PgdA/CDA1 family)